MEKTIRLQQLESEMEQLRTELYQVVDEKTSQLSHPQVLPTSEQLDILIMEFIKEQQRQKSY